MRERGESESKKERERERRKEERANFKIFMHVALATDMRMQFIFLVSKTHYFSG